MTTCTCTLALNYRKIKQDISPAILKDGKRLYDQDQVVSAKILELDSSSIKICGSVIGNYDHTYESSLEICRLESEIIDSSCDCPYGYDCQHLAALLFYLENHFDQIMVAYSKEAHLEEDDSIDEEEKAELLEAFKQAEGYQEQRLGQQLQNEVLEEYSNASKLLRRSPFFLPREKLIEDKAELAVIFTLPSLQTEDHRVAPEFQIALRLQQRSKPLYIPNICQFLSCIRYMEPYYISGKRYFFTHRSFSNAANEILSLLIDHIRYNSSNTERYCKSAHIDFEAFGSIMAKAYDFAVFSNADDAPPILPCLYNGSLERSFSCSNKAVNLRFDLQFFEAPAPKILLDPFVVLPDDEAITPDETYLCACAIPGIVYKNTYFRFSSFIKRMHLQNLKAIRDMTIPEPLFGTFVEKALPELQCFAEVTNRAVLKKFITLPYNEKLKARCDINYLDETLEARLYFLYNDLIIPASNAQLSYNDIASFVTSQGILSRNLAEERSIIDDLFVDFSFNKKEGIFTSSNEKKIIGFMTQVIPNNQHRVEFYCPENLLEQFIYDQTSFKLALEESNVVGTYNVNITIDGPLDKVPLKRLQECLDTDKPYLTLQHFSKEKNNPSPSKPKKTLVLNLKHLKPIIEILEELNIEVLETQKLPRPLWSLVTIDPQYMESLPINFSCSRQLNNIRQQLIGERSITPSPTPPSINATLRKYQQEGSQWLEKLRKMHLGGILADDMGLGKTLQAIVSITLESIENPSSLSIVVSPTSLLYNWKEEFNKFNSDLNIIVIDGTPLQRKKLLEKAADANVIITSYGLLQKDIEVYKSFDFSYAILDEAQHIKNPDTLNAKSTKMLNAKHRLILTGTPIENSLHDLWSLFDFLMPGLLHTYDRFNERYIRSSALSHQDRMSALRKKISPFILRRMKKDVLDDLPPVSHISYHCQLSKVQQELYSSHAASAREELSLLVEKEGFEKVRLHVLATLTRLKQICCHPGIFAKDTLEKGDSAKYEMLLDMLSSLIDSGHRTVIFSQYAQMLHIIKEDLQRMGIKFCYLDGNTKNRLKVVHEFNENSTIPIFLVSLKAGGSGLNLVGADTVIHYDLWWNPAIESQATDRVHRLGQSNPVSSYKLITLGTIEEKILQLQERKKHLVQNVITSDNETISKLSWEEVLELLQT
ncbi:MAG: SNF2-related protein [Chlamydiota bacterium]